MTALPRILLFGCSGQIGTETRELLNEGGYEYTAIDREQCDLSKPGSAAAVIHRTNPQVIVNAAAYTSVDQAESEPEIAKAVNATAPAEMARAAREIGALLVHYSTDYVFNGERSTPWTEADATDPINTYGRTKHDGEVGILELGAAAIVFRTSWVYAPHGKNFLRTMLKQGAEKEEVSVISDQIGAPTTARSLAEVTLHTIRLLSRTDGGIDLAKAEALAGIYHASSSGQTSWHGFAEAIFDEARKLGFPLRVRSVRPITSHEWPCAAKRPKWSLLSSTKLAEKLGYQLPHWHEGLRQVMAALSGPANPH